MPFGLCNAPVTSERLMETVLQGLTWKTCLSCKPEVKPKEVRIIPEVRYLGHIISADGIRTDPEKTEAVRCWPVPRNQHEIRSSLELCSYYRKFIKNFAQIARPIHQLTENGRPSEWSEDCATAYEELKRALSSPPVLSYPNPGDMFILNTDASNTAIGDVLSQLQDGEEKVIAYYSRVLSKPELNYCVTRRELLTMIKSVRYFHKYLYGQPFLLRTDHASLKWLLQFKNPEGQIAPGLQSIQEYDFKIEHRRGSSQKNADALSRRPCLDNCKCCNRHEEREDQEQMICRRSKLECLEEWEPSIIAKEQEEDPDIGPIYQLKAANKDKPFWQEISIVTNGKERVFQTILPKKRVVEVLRYLHNGVGAGYFGVNKTLEKIKERFYWDGCRTDVENWCRACTECSASKGPRSRSRGPMRQYLVGSPFERIAIDVQEFSKLGESSEYRPSAAAKAGLSSTAKETEDWTKIGLDERLIDKIQKN
ncbi:hypothetical protein HUJ05_004313 [Dendroctonus ponderosae]|nr:hypothetical protein HUJ05_004313 [Dendroctonus ponderosae]